ncbi:MAG: glycoside hydrolase [Brevinema sp.]
MKLAVLGGGGVRSPLLAKSLAISAKKAGIDSLVFMDNDTEKLSVFGEISRQIVQVLDPSLKFSATSNVEEAVEGADYVITTLRVGGDKGRVEDEVSALSLGVLGQETTGPGGFAMAMRSLPTLLEYGRLIEKKAQKGAVTFNFTNPAALVTQGLNYAGISRNFGICDGPAGQIHEIKELLKATEEDTFTAECYGLNHLSWFRDFKLNGKDISETVVNHPGLYKDTSFRMFDPELVRYFGGALPNTYLYFFYYREKAVQSILESGSTRGKAILDINQRMMKALSTKDPKKHFAESFEIFMTHLLEREKSYMSLESKDQGGHHISAIPNLDAFLAAPDSGGYAGVALEYIRIVQSGKSQRMILNVPNTNNAIDFLSPEDVIETDCMVHSDGTITPSIHRDIPAPVRSLISSMKEYERLAARAILERSISKAREALMIHPLIMSYSLADQILAKYLKAHAPYIGEWK